MMDDEGESSSFRGQIALNVLKTHLDELTLQTSTTTT